MLDEWAAEAAARELVLLDNHLGRVPNTLEPSGQPYEYSMKILYELFLLSNQLGGGPNPFVTPRADLGILNLNSKELITIWQLTWEGAKIFGTLRSALGILYRNSIGLCKTYL